MTQRIEGKKKKILLLWVDDMVAPTVPTISHKMQEKQTPHCIVVVCGKITSMSLTATRLLAAQTDKKEIEIFKLSETLFDVFSHCMVPKHEICGATEKRNVYNDYRVQKGQLPKICSTEMTCRILGAKKGQLIRIERKNDTMGTVDGEEITTITYREVV
jgi:DNA-directed RNA polymerase subunit H (RpoH/RPB5)